MKISSDSFGLVIAFLLPGFICLWGLSYSLPGLATWLAQSSGSSVPTVGGFFYSTLASLSLGLLISAIRWAIIDKIHEWTRVTAPNLNFTKLNEQTSLDAFQAAVEAHYRYYQYYANTLIGVIIGFPMYFFNTTERPSSWLWMAFALTLGFLFFGSRDALGKYYDRTQQILGVKTG